MAYMNKEKKAIIAAAIKPVLAKYGMKATLSTDRISISLNIKSGNLDIIRNYNETLSDYNLDMFGAAKDNMTVNHFWIHDSYTGYCKEFLLEAYEALKSANWYNNSDIQSDYFDIGYYIHINVGNWDKPYLLNEKSLFTVDVTFKKLPTLSFLGVQAFSEKEAIQLVKAQLIVEGYAYNTIKTVKVRK